MQDNLPHYWWYYTIWCWHPHFFGEEAGRISRHSDLINWRLQVVASHKNTCHQNSISSILPLHAFRWAKFYVRDCWQITVLTLNRCWQLSKNLPDPPLFLMDNIKLDRITTKIKWKGYDYFTLHFKFWEGTSVKICKIQLSALLFLVVLQQFFYNFLELHWSLLKKKKIFVTNFLFLTDLPKSPFLYRQKSAKHDSFVVDIPE